MEKLTDSQILTKLVTGLKTLEPEEFNYDKFITKHKFDENNNICGTVCCAWGWVHKFVPEIGVKIIFDKWNTPIISAEPSTILDLDIETIDFMFYDGNNLRFGYYKNAEPNDLILFGSSHSNDLNLNHVINRIEYVIKNETKNKK